jgi:hypothetical protein
MPGGQGLVPTGPPGPHGSALTPAPPPPSQDWFANNGINPIPGGNFLPAYGVQYGAGYTGPTYAGTDPTQSGSQTVTQPTSAFGPTTNWGDQGAIASFYQSNGVTPAPTSIDYWTNEWNTWGKSDPNYFWTRISANDEFVAAGKAKPYGGTGGDGPVAPDTVANFGLPANPYASTAFGETYAQPAKPADLQGEFTAPTLADLQASPGYAARLQAAQTGQERNLLALGFGGGTLKALDRYSQDYASNEYSNLYGQNLSTRQQNTNEYQQDVSNYNTGYTNRYQSWLDENARTLNDYLTNYNINRNYASDWWNQSNAVANRGLNAATAAKPSA